MIADDIARLRDFRFVREGDSEDMAALRRVLDRCEALEQWADEVTAAMARLADQFGPPNTTEQYERAQDVLARKP